MSSEGEAIEVAGVRHTYGARVALDDVAFSVRRGELFGLLGPNGGGKTTLFRVLATLLRVREGDARILGASVRHTPDIVRHHLGVVFQHPSLDGLLTVSENLVCHGRLYGLRGTRLRQRAALLLDRMGLAERAGDRVNTLSGGLQRRAELAKALLHAPPVLLLDEPSTGLDPGARRDFLHYLSELRERDGVTVVLTTHYMDEAERCDRVAILDRGRLIGVDAPHALKAKIGGEVIVIQAPDTQGLAARIEARFGCAVSVVDGAVRIERARGPELVRDLVDAFPAEVTAVTYGKPTLDDVFIHLTGHRFWATGGEAAVT
jgi:ABC-2 type transport system ATP-binding protein